MRLNYIVGVIFFFCCLQSAVFGQDVPAYNAIGVRAYDLLQAKTINPKTKLKTVKIAVIDDAFSITHKKLAPYYYVNTAEVRSNLKDDDQNGYTDDFQGWDIADGDNKVSLPNERGNSAKFLHGSMVAGVIIQAAEQALGAELTRDHIRIVPIKVISDKALNGSYEQGYEGFKYAVDMGVDIICMAWSGGRFDSKYLPYFEKAKQKGILVLASAGNFNSDVTTPPNSLPGVYAVAAVDTSFRKLPLSNYNSTVALSAVAQRVRAPYALNDSLYTYLENTSAAVALISGCAAVIKAIKPELSPDEIIDILQNTATTIDGFNPYLTGKLGAGVVNMSQVTEYLANSKGKLATYFNPKRPKGSIWLNKQESFNPIRFELPAKESTIVFSVVGNTNKQQALLTFTNSDGQLVHQSTLQEFPDELPIPGVHTELKIKGKLSKELVRLKYTVVNKDSTRFYCDDTQTIVAEEGVIEDGSGPNLYTGNNDCKWVIEVPKGQNVQLDFEAFATQVSKDHLFIFKGNETLQENLMARFSGNELPPSLVIDGNQVLLWFVTDLEGYDQGFKVRFKATSSKPGIIVPTKPL